MKIFFSLVFLLASSSAFASMKQIVCEGLTVQSKQRITVSFCLNTSGIGEFGEVSKIKTCKENNPVLITKERSDGTLTQRTFPVGSGSIVSSTDDSSEYLLTNFDGDIEGVELEAEGYKVVRISTITEGTDSFQVFLNEKWWNGYSFSKAECIGLTPEAE